MKLVAIILIVFASFCISAEPSERAEPSKPPLQDHIDRLSELPFTDWTITKEASAIVLTSKFDVYAFNGMSLGGNVIVDESTPEHILRMKLAPEKYVIRLEFGKHISRKELERRLAERKPFADTLTHGASGKDGKSKWGEARKRFQEIKVPRYDDFDFSIYRNTPEDVNITHYPLSAMAKIGSALYLLDYAFQGPITPYD